MCKNVDFEFNWLNQRQQNEIQFILCFYLIEIWVLFTEIGNVLESITSSFHLNQPVVLTQNRPVKNKQFTINLPLTSCQCHFKNTKLSATSADVTASTRLVPSRPVRIWLGRSGLWDDRTLPTIQRMFDRVPWRRHIFIVHDFPIFANWKRNNWLEWELGTSLL